MLNQPQTNRVGDDAAKIAVAFSEREPGVIGNARAADLKGGRWPAQPRFWRVRSARRRPGTRKSFLLLPFRPEGQQESDFGPLSSCPSARGWSLAPAGARWEVSGEDCRPTSL